MPEDKGQQEEGAFDELFGTKGTEEPNPTHDEGQGEKESVPEKDEKLEKLTSQVKGQQEYIRQLAEDNKSLKEKVSKVDQIGEIFSPKPEEKAEEDQKALLEKFDTDPLSVVEHIISQKLDKRVAPLENTVSTNSLSYNAKEVMNEIDKTHSVNWDKDSAKIVKQLNNFNQDFKTADPKGALIHAMTLAGVGKKRQDLPFYEGAGNPATFLKKKLQSEGQAYKSSFKKAAGNKIEHPLKGFFNSIK